MLPMSVSYFWQMSHAITLGKLGKGYMNTFCTIFATTLQIKIYSKLKTLFKKDWVNTVLRYLVEYYKWNFLKSELDMRGLLQYEIMFLAIAKPWPTKTTFWKVYKSNN